ncbi:MAG: hypothetical protein E7667_05405 [Ruminococcaceae bacterium]|nr:hypothetical protein [Oscillospiraceae bacterium]
MNTKKKIISLMVAVFTVMAIIPFGAIGASAALVEVDSIAISGVGVPVVGEKPDYANMVSDKAPYTLEETVWVNVTDNVVLGENENFVGGKQYKVVFTFKAKVDYEFKANGSTTAVEGTVNGIEAEVAPVSGKDIDRYLSVSYTFPTLDVIQINQINIAGLARPAMNAYPDFEATENGVGYTVKEVRWHDDTTNADVSGSLQFVGGRVYTVYIEVEANEGYIFNADWQGNPIVGGIINGSALDVNVDVTAGKLAKTNVTLSYTFGQLQTLPIKYVETTVTVPVDGAYPSGKLTLPEDCGYVSAVTSVTWKDENGNVMTGTAPFADGKKYTVTFKLRAETGYEFDIYEATVNNQAAEATLQSDGTVDISCTFTCKGNKIESVNLVSPYPPVTGQLPYFGVESTDATYVVKSVKWSYENPDYATSGGEQWLYLAEDEVFEEGVTYFQEIHMEAIDGFYFCEVFGLFPEVTFNGEPVDSNDCIPDFKDHDSENYDAFIIMRSYVCGKGELRDVTVDGIDLPTHGYTPETDFYVGEGQKITNVEWIDASDYNKVMGEDDTFIYGHEYYVRITVQAEDGYTLTEMARLGATVNGKYANIVGYSSATNEVTLTYEFVECLPDEILLIELEGLDSAIHGEAADYELEAVGDSYDINGNKNDLTYKNGVAWYDETDGGFLRVGDTLVEGHEYTVYVYVYALDGYIFGGPKPATVDGFDAVSEAYEDINENYVLCVKYSMIAGHLHTYDDTVFNGGDDEYHWRQCIDENCPDYEASIKDKTQHTGGEAGCGAQAVCEECGNSYGLAGEHQWSEDFDKDAEGHARYCTVEGCGVMDQREAHTPGIDAPTEDQAQVCMICGYIIAPALNHTTHTPADEWMSDAFYHWHECTGCEGQKLQETEHADTDNDEECDACGYAMPGAGTEPSTEPTTEPTTEENTKPSNKSKNKEEKNGLPTGAVVGIVIGSVAVVGIGVFAIVWFAVKKKTFADLISIFKK